MNTPLSSASGMSPGGENDRSKRPRVRHRLVSLAVAALAVAGAALLPSTPANAVAIDPTTDMAVTAWGSNRLDLFARGTDGTLKHMLFNGRWSTWESLGGAIASAPAVASWAPGRLDVFARSTGNSLLHRWYVNGAWSGWEDLGGVLTSAPAVASWGTGRLDVFGKGTNNAIYQRTFSGSWTPGWTSLGGSMATAPAVDSWTAGRLEIFARGTDGVLQHRVFSSSAWGAWATMPDTVPATPIASYSPTVALQASPAAGALVGPIEYAYVDNIGRLVFGHQADPANVGSVQWTVVSGNEAFSGPPALAEQPDKRVQVTGHHTSSDVWARAQSAAGSATWGGWVDQGGVLASALTVGKQGDGSLVMFGVDRNGALLSMAQSSLSGSFGTWRNLGDVDLVGVPRVVTTQDALQVFGVDATGAVRTMALSTAGTATGWTSLGGTGATGTPAAVVYPGYRMRVFVRSADGTIVTKAQDSAGLWPAAWDPVGTFVAAGSPSAVLSPSSGRTELVARSSDGSIFSTGETAQGSGVWRDWIPVLQGGDLAATDPTAFTYSDGAALRWAFVFRNADNQNRLYTVDTSTVTINVPPTFGGRTMPAAPA